MSRRNVRTLTAFLLAIGLAALVWAPTPAAEVDPAEAARLLAGRELGETPMIDDLRELCDGIGGRLTGSPACNRAIEWAAAKFRAAGVDDVHLEPFTLAHSWQGNRVEAECLKPDSFRIRLVSVPYSPSVAGGTLEAPLVDVGEGAPADFEKLGERARGAVALVRSKEMHTLNDLFLEYQRDKPLLKAAQKAGVAALWLESTRARLLLYRHPMTFNGDPTPVPVALVAREHAERLARLFEKGPVSVRLTLQNTLGGPVESQNVVAEIRGSEKPDEIVLLGAHLDSWELGTGAQDNGVNASLVIDVARGIRALGLRPRRTMRFVLFTGEEQGMIGSMEYVLRHRDEIGRHVAVVIFDVGSGRTQGFYLDGRPELDKPVEQVLHAVDGLGADQNEEEAIDGTDNFDFLLSGVPNLVADQDWNPYLPDYHAESDTFDKVDQRNARLNAAIAAVMVWGLAEAPAPPAPRQTRAEVERMIEASGFDRQMKMLGQWEDWVAGRRGVSK